jgi:hypothetical protein
VKEWTENQFQKPSETKNKNAKIREKMETTIREKKNNHTKK